MESNCAARAFRRFYKETGHLILIGFIGGSILGACDGSRPQPKAQGGGQPAMTVPAGGSVEHTVTEDQIGGGSTTEAAAASAGYKGIGGDQAGGIKIQNPTASVGADGATSADGGTSEADWSVKASKDGYRILFLLLGLGGIGAGIYCFTRAMVRPGMACVLGGAGFIVVGLLPSAALLALSAVAVLGAGFYLWEAHKAHTGSGDTEIVKKLAKGTEGLPDGVRQVAKAEIAKHLEPKQRDRMRVIKNKLGLPSERAPVPPPV